jgi:hypothetical protein
MIECMFEQRAPGELVGVITESQRQESMLVARRLAAVAELLGHRTAEVEAEDPDPGYMIVTGFHRTTAEVAAAMNLAPMAASFVVSHADTLDSRLPKVAAVLAAGDTDWRTVQLIITRTELVRDSVIARIDANLAGRIAKWQCWSRKRIINAVDAAVRALDPDAIRERMRREDNRHIDVTALGDGTAKVDGIIATDAAVVFDKRLTELATAVCPDDPRTIAARRADAMKALAEGRRLACACGCDDCPNRTDDQAPASRTIINVIAGQQTVIGDSRQPGYMEGYGVIDADQVRDLASEATLRLLTEPAVSPAEALRYQPSAALERWIRMRDLTCRFPGCDRPASACDIDHTIPFNHVDPTRGGRTVAWNLKCMCRQHHRLKTFHDGWHDIQLPDGTIVWTSPTGQTYRTKPGGVDLFPRLGPPPCTAPAPYRRDRTRERAARLARKRKRNRELRPINAEKRWVDYARRREIEALKNRNRMRRTLILFKGRQASTSPFSTWINDPFEPEELPPDWRPPPPPAPEPDEPPF